MHILVHSAERTQKKARAMSLEGPNDNADVNIDIVAIQDVSQTTNLLLATLVTNLVLSLSLRTKASFRC